MSGALGTALQLVGGLASSVWRANLRQGSFRGVPFHFDQAAGTYGRRYAMHEYPGRDVPYAEDLGRAQRVWTFQAYVLGPAFLATRSALAQACEQPGPGSLVLPLIGRVSAVCTSIDFSDAKQQGGYSSLSLNFAEAGERLSPAGTEDSRSLIGDAAAQLGIATDGMFTGGFDVGQGQTYLASAAAGDVSDFSGQLDASRRPSYGYDQAPLVSAIGALSQQAGSLVYSAPNLFSAVDNSFAAYTDATPADAGFSEMLSFATGYRSHPVEVPDRPAALTEGRVRRIARLTTTDAAPLREAEAANAGLFQSLIRRLALREIGYLLPGVSLDNTERAEQTRKLVFDSFQAEADAACEARDDVSFLALTTLAHRILTDLDIRAAQLPSLIPYRTGRSFNAITLAHQLYGDANRNLEIVARIGVINPAFMPLAGRVLDR